MDSLYWKHNGFDGRSITIGSGNAPIGQLSFIEQWNSDAIYTSELTKISFKNKGLFNTTVKVIYNGGAVGEIRNTFMRAPAFHFTNGSGFHLKSDLFNRNLKWVDRTGKGAIHFIQPTMGSFGKGKITAAGEVTLTEREVLISAGLFAQQLIKKKLLLIALIIVPVTLLLR